MERYERRPCFCRIRCTCRSSDFLLFAKNGFVVGVRALKVTAPAETTPAAAMNVSVPRIARRYTIPSAAHPTRIHMVYIELDGVMQAGREGAGKERGRSEERKDGGCEGGSKGRVGGNNDVREGGLREGVEEGNERGMYRTRQGWSEEEREQQSEGDERGREGGREGRREGGREERGREGGAREGGKCQGRYPEEDNGQYTVHKTTHNTALALETLVFQLKMLNGYNIL